MKKCFLNSSLKIIKKKYPNISKTKSEEILYGLESFYLTIEKLIVITALAIILGKVKEVFTLIICFNIIRSTAFGLHASKSIYCLITSLTMFVGGVYVCEYVNLSISIKVLLSCATTILIFKYAPADTKKRPLINPQKRKKYKIVSTISAGIATIIIIIFNSNAISNYLLLGLIEATILILPITYNIFNFPYNNYEKYLSIKEE